MRVLSVFASFLLLSVAHANPTGGNVQSGSATINSSGSTLTVNTSTTNTTINWQTFSIGSGETTRFNQPSSSSVVLNRVVGTDPSTILGTLSSNGQIFIVNPSGFTIGSGAQINVAGLNLSTSDSGGPGGISGSLLSTISTTTGGGGGTIAVVSGGSLTVGSTPALQLTTLTVQGPVTTGTISLKLEKRLVAF
ncbi:MAG TPA: filamentous hemagglutinin N-terminal domain-containing protein [Burkholderiales bacterium]|nr:filamentous hemagglutinin N-terminal domain-containing protein [Burkholderiales bacterium]